MSKFKAGDRVKVIAYTDDNWYDERWVGKEYTVSKCYSGYVSLAEFGNETYGFEPSHVELVNETPSKLNVNGAVELLQGLLDYGYDPDVEIVLKHDSVRVNAFGSTFLVGSEGSLEAICKAITLLSGAKLGD